VGARVYHSPAREALPPLIFFDDEQGFYPEDNDT